jgi:hypothetical protein
MGKDHSDPGVEFEFLLLQPRKVRRSLGTFICLSVMGGIYRQNFYSMPQNDIGKN